MAAVNEERRPRAADQSVPSQVPLEMIPLDQIPQGEYAFPGPLRDELVSAILSGAKTATSCLLAEYGPDEDPLDALGSLEAVLDSHGRIVCVTRVDDVRVVRLGDVTDEHARAEGEGYRDAAAWRAGHEQFWRSAEYVEEVGLQELTDETPVVCVRIMLDERFPTRPHVPWDADMNEAPPPGRQAW